MNTGVISSRYAKALLLLSDERGSADRVYSQVKAMIANPDVVPSPLEPDLQEFIQFLVKNKRIGYVKFIFSSFERQYLESRNMKKAKLVTAVPSPELESKLRLLIKEKLGFELELTSVVEPDIIGGFRFEVDDLLLDASVSSQIAKLRSQLIEKYTRIV